MLVGCGVMLASAVVGLGAGSEATLESREGFHGLPFTRFYSFDEIGNVGPSARLGFDRFGRVAAFHAGAYVVLNDNSWIDIASKEQEVPVIQRVAYDQQGRAYYGGFGTWGLVDWSPQGLLLPRSLRPPTVPSWVADVSFNEVVPTAGGVYFAGYSGIVRWDRQSHGQAFLEFPNLSRMFAVGEQVFASSLLGGIEAVELADGKLRTVPVASLDGAYVDQVTGFGPGRVLFSSVDGRLFIFDGSTVAAWPAPSQNHLGGRITALRTMVDGTVAASVIGKGLFFFAAQGQSSYSLTTPEFHRITDLASREKGVLWVATENGIAKVLYESPLTMFGQRLGLPLSWPQVVRWRDRIVVASGGRLYESVRGPSNGPTRFELIPGQPSAEIWGLAAAGDRMLVGNKDGVFVRGDDGGFARLPVAMGVARLVMINDSLCFAISSAEITALEWRDGHWSETTARVKGVGYPSVVHATKTAVWIELGANRAARVLLRDGALNLRVFDQFPWHDPRWVNVGVVDDTVVLVGLPDGRVYFDEAKEKFVPRPDLAQMFNRSPFPIARLKQDDHGTIWASCPMGVLKIHPERDGYRVEPTSYGKINDNTPVIRVLPGADIWLTAGQSLYHVDSRAAPQEETPARPMLVSVVDARTNREIGEILRPGIVPVLQYAQNSLAFRFFAGTYKTRQSPAYEFRLNRGGNAWRPLGDGSLLTLTDLREGDYRLDVKLVGSHADAVGTASYGFEIKPPWYRTWYAFLCYFLGVVGALFGLMSWLTFRSRARNQELAELVATRTEDLRVAMERLNEETRNAATFAERDRLAGEIHDSLQQGLNGLMLQLDATLKLPGLAADVRSRLGVARNMVSFTRHEVQNAVWDMESPLLEGTNLGDALQKLTALIGPGEARVEIKVNGRPAALAPAINHHLLRIAQEAITNAVRHAAASTITISLDYRAEGVALTVTDDGNGFVPHDVLTTGLGHFGLRGLRGRAAKIGGELEIRSAPGGGTTIHVAVRTPVPADSHANGG